MGSLCSKRAPVLQEAGLVAQAVAQAPVAPLPVAPVPASPPPPTKKTDDDHDDIEDEVNKVGDVKKFKWADGEFKGAPLVEFHPEPLQTANLNVQVSDRRDGKVGDRGARHSASVAAHNKTLLTVA